jgi:hypothetical protein
LALNRVAILQPYFLPYIGYFQLINNVDVLILADEYEYSKGGWINRNRLIFNKKVDYISIPLVSAPDSLKINERQISNTFDPRKILNRCAISYGGCDNFFNGNELMEMILLDANRDLFSFLLNSIDQICKYLDVNTEIISLSKLSNNKSLKRQDRVIDICRTLEASSYLNPEGGRGLYRAEAFEQEGMQLEFLEHTPILYGQVVKDFIPRLSVMDLIYMVETKQDLRLHLNSCQIVKARE